MNTARPKARLLSQSGATAGASFELGERATIGSAPSHDIVLAAAGLAPDHARIAFEEGDYRIEALGGGGKVIVDGVPISGQKQLGKLHVIELCEGVEFVFMRDEPVVEEPRRDPAPSEPAHPPEAAPAPQASHTVVDLQGFGALPERLRRKEPEPPPPPAEVGHTVVDMEGFGAFPERLQGPVDPDLAGETVVNLEVPEPPPVMPSAPSSPLVVRRIRIELTSPDAGSRSYDLEEGEHVLGRGNACTIPVADPEMWLSRRHVVLRVGRDSVEVEDLRSVNGTFVEDLRIERTTLTPGSSFRMGPHVHITLREP